jgi:DNA-binding NarL/FixJ family response regulator
VEPLRWGTEVAPMNTQAQSRSDAQPSFCKRELAVLRLLAKEQSSQQIGDALSIEKRTAEVYIQLITAKLRAVNSTHAVAVAIRNKII